MNRDDVEMVLEKSLTYWRENLKEKISLIDINALADQIWKDIQFETNAKEETIEFVMSKSQLMSLEKWGDIALILDDDKEVYITYLDDTESIALTESGKIIVFGQEEEE